MQPRVVRRGDHIFHAGQACGPIYVVRSGAIKTYVVLRNGDIQITGFSGPGDVIGLEGIDEEAYACSAVALVDPSTRR